MDIPENPVREALCLMNCMIESGEKHSDGSRELFRAALDSLATDHALAARTRKLGRDLNQLQQDLLQAAGTGEPRYNLAHNLLQRASTNVSDAANAALMAEEHYALKRQPTEPGPSE